MQTLGFVFPGQGSQSVGMLADLADAHDIVKNTFDEASDIMGRDMWSLVQNGPEEELALTEITQPVMLVGSIAAYRAWENLTDVRPAIMAGHSLGEYSAYVCAGSMTFADGVKVVKKRSELMRDACPEGQGGMAAILGLDDEVVVACCAEAAQGQVVQAVNFNSPGQIVIAGHREALNRAIELCNERGARRALPLAISVPCHSDLMKAASDELKDTLLATPFAKPEIPVINNIDAGIEMDPDIIRQKLVEQLYSPVQWVGSIQTMTAQNVDTIVECGPGKVLTGMTKRIQKGLSLYTLQDQTGLSAALQAVTE